MKSWIWASVAALAVAAIAPGEVLGVPNPDAMMALHVATRSAKNPCNIPVPSDCADFVIKTTDSGFYNIYLTVTGYDSTGIAGAQFGVSYENQNGMGCDIDAWQTCADLQFGDDNFPESGSGNLITWDPEGACQGDFETYTPIIAGVFVVTTYSGDLFSITPRPVDGKAKVANCLAAETDLTDFDPSRLGVVVFGTGTGYNPCLGPQTPVRSTTWGSIKTLYEH
jgi:hypothetical protein